MGVEHTVEVSADSLYEAVARGLAAMRDADWAGEIGHGQTTISVVVRQPELERKVLMRDLDTGFYRDKLLPIGPGQGELLYLLARSKGVRCAVEFGTSFGVSTIYLAAAIRERKLTAILCADVNGYSRLMGEDEEATLCTLSAYRKLRQPH
jgi:hypothetical protein